MIDDSEPRQLERRQCAEEQQRGNKQLARATLLCTDIAQMLEPRARFVCVPIQFPDLPPSLPCSTSYENTLYQSTGGWPAHRAFCPHMHPHRGHTPLTPEHPNSTGRFALISPWQYPNSLVQNPKSTVATLPPSENIMSSIIYQEILLPYN